MGQNRALRTLWTDIGIFSGSHPRAKGPLILGHEFIGRVEVPSHSGPFAKDTWGTAFPLRSCGHCHACRTGRTHTCGNLRLLGIDEAGRMAEHLLVDDALLINVPDDEL